jgi:hypothetical protein
MAILVVTGSAWLDKTDVPFIRSKLDEAKSKTTGLIVMHGGATGADEVADEWCEDNGVYSLCVKALWKARGQKAGRERNEFMVTQAKGLAIIHHTFAYAFPAPESKGTLDCVKRLRNANIETTVFRVKGSKRPLQRERL